MWSSNSRRQFASNSVFGAPAGVADEKRRRDSAADAARRAIAMDLAVAGIHHAEVALAVHDLAGELDVPQTRSPTARAAPDRVLAHEPGSISIMWSSPR